MGKYFSQLLDAPIWAGRTGNAVGSGLGGVNVRKAGIDLVKSPATAPDRPNRFKVAPACMWGHFFVAQFQFFIVLTLAVPLFPLPALARI